MNSKRLFPAVAASALFIVSGCTSDRALSNYEEPNLAAIPDGYVALLDGVVDSAWMTGTIAGEVVDADARVRAGEGTGTLGIELAAPSQSGAAVMHLLEFDAARLAELQPGETLQYQMDDLEPALIPIACAGPVVDDWAIDVTVESADVTLVEEEDGTRRYDWTVATIQDDAEFAVPETSAGSVTVNPMPLGEAVPQ